MADGAYRIVVIGAGFGGLTAAKILKQRGIDFTVYEKADEVGGTWRENTYPGLYVDVPSRQYEFPFRPNYDWSRQFAPAPEIQAYIKDVTDELGLRRFIRFNEEIVSVRFEDGRWRIATAMGETDVADAIICATGFLREPIYPDIEGRDSFAGSAFHSARWDHGVEIAVGIDRLQRLEHALLKPVDPQAAGGADRQRRMAQQAVAVAGHRFVDLVQDPQIGNPR